MRRLPPTRPSTPFYVLTTGNTGANARIAARVAIPVGRASLIDVAELWVESASDGEGHAVAAEMQSE